MALVTSDVPRTGRVHILGAGPVGLLMTALLQSMDGMSVHLYEKRPAYTRTRMVTLAPYLIADSVESIASTTSTARASTPSSTPQRSKRVSRSDGRSPRT